MTTDQEAPFEVSIVCPDLGVTSGGVEVVQWLVDPGTVVCAGDRVLELLAEGVVVHVVAPADGVLSAVRVSTRRVVATGDLLTVIEAAPSGGGL